MDIILLLYLLISLTIEQGSNPGGISPNINSNKQPNQNIPYNPQQYGNFGANNGDPRNYQWGQIPQNGNIQRNRNIEPPLYNQIGTTLYNNYNYNPNIQRGNIPQIQEYPQNPNQPIIQNQQFPNNLQNIQYPINHQYPQNQQNPVNYQNNNYTLNQEIQRNQPNLMNNQKPAQIPKIQLNEAQIPNNMENQTIHPNNFKNQQNVINEAHKPNLIGRKTDQNRTSNDNQNQAINMKQNNQPKKTETKKIEENQIEKIYIPQNVPFPKNFESIFNPKKVNTSRHYEDCDNKNIFCLNNLKCKFNRCFTKYETKNYKRLGLHDKNICADNDDCPAKQECIKHRCVKDEDEVDINKRNNGKNPTVNLLFAGSIFLNNRSYNSGINSNGTFNYNHLFQYIKDDIKKADLAIVDQETIFETNKTNFVKKVSNTPTELGDAIVNAGFKVVLHGTLYSFIKAEKGIINTLNFWKKKYPQIKILGINDKQSENVEDYYIFQKNGIKIGLVNFYIHGKKLIPKNKQHYVNMIRKEKVKTIIGKLNKETDFVIACVNWGNKNTKKPNKNQIKWAKILAQNGAKLIVGHHPTITLPISNIKSKGKRALVLWSLGSLVTDINKKYSILSTMANITITKSDEDTFISEYNLIPTITHKGNGKHFSVYKLSQYSEELFKKSELKITNFKREDIVKKCKNIMDGIADCY